jgi:dienelactone hydrolase
MAPEVIEGREATVRSDLYSLGVILYQLLAEDFGRSLAPGWERDVGDPLLRADLAACVDGAPGQRLPGPAALAERLRGLPARRAGERNASTRRRSLRAAAIGLIVIALGFGAQRAYRFWSRVRWAQEEAQPALAAFIEVNDFASAFELASEIEDALGSTPALEPVWALISAEVAFETEPVGATVSYRRYGDPSAEWKELGTTPIASARVPRGPSEWRIEKAGHRTRTFGRLPSGGGPDSPFAWPSHFVLDPDDTELGDVVPVQGRRYFQVSLGGFPVAASYELDRFHIDRTEVRNDAYQEFVDAGGYRRAEFWTESFRDGERVLDFQEAMARFVDSTGRPGPAAWVGGRYPPGSGAHPVGGVSWFEAQAYAQFRGRALPTAYHWAAAALPDNEIIDPLAPALAARSNLDSRGSRPVGSADGVSAAGAADMFGNVSEWVWTARGADQHFTLGLGWSDPAYNASLATAASPWSRLPTQGLRLATYTSGDPDPSLLEPVAVATVDYASLTPLTEDAFSILRSLVRYEPTPVRETGERVTLPGELEALRVEVETPYSDERLPLFVFEPDGGGPPYQALVWFGGINAIANRDNASLYGLDMQFSSFLRQSGRLVVMPIWTGTFERNDGSTLRRFLGSAEGQAEVIRGWTRDLRRTIDYIESRGDVEGIAYVGLSLGSAVGASMLAHEPRLDTAILWSGGFAASAAPENARNNADLVRRTRLPVLMLNGRHDFLFPLELQRVFFELLGTPPEHKRHVVWDAGHFGWPLGEFVRENLDWLDRYLGPVVASGG